MSEQKSPSWIDRVMERMPASQGGGDFIIGNVGSSTVTAIGKYIVQVTDVLGKPQVNDPEEIAKAVRQLRDEFQKLAPQLSDGMRYVAEDKINTIEQQLSKKDGPPSGDLIRAAGDWLLEHIPAIGSALASTFLPESVGRIVALAGPATIEWIKGLFNRSAS